MHRAPKVERKEYWQYRDTVTISHGSIYVVDWR